MTTKTWAEINESVKNSTPEVTIEPSKPIPDEVFDQIYPDQEPDLQEIEKAQKFKLAIEIQRLNHLSKIEKLIAKYDEAILDLEVTTLADFVEASNEIAGEIFGGSFDEYKHRIL